MKEYGLFLKDYTTYMLCRFGIYQRQLPFLHIFHEIQFFNWSHYITIVNVKTYVKRYMIFLYKFQLLTEINLGTTLKKSQLKCHFKTYWNSYLKSNVRLLRYLCDFYNKHSTLYPNGVTMYSPFNFHAIIIHKLYTYILLCSTCPFANKVLKIHFLYSIDSKLKK